MDPDTALELAFTGPEPEATWAREDLDDWQAKGGYAPKPGPFPGEVRDA